MSAPDFVALMNKQEKSSKDSSAQDFVSLMQKQRSAPEKAARMGAQYGIGLVERAALPYDIAVSPLASKSAQSAELRKQTFEDIEQLLEQKQTGRWSPQDELFLKELTAQIQHPKRMEKHVRTADISSSGLIEKGAKKLGVDLEPEGFAEHAARFGGNLFRPKTIASAAKSIPEKVTQLASKEGRAALKLSNQWKSLDKAAKGNAIKEDLLNFSKAKNLTPEEATLLLQSKGNIDILGKISKKTKRFKGIAEGLKTKLQSSYEELKDLGRKGGHITPAESDKLAGDLTSVLEDIGRTYVEGPDTKGARELIERAIFNVENKAGTVEDLINSRRNLRQFSTWKNLHEGDAIRSKAEKAIFNAIERKNPEIAKKLSETDKAWSQYKKFEKLFEKPATAIKWHGIPVNTPIGAIAFAGTGLLTGHLPLALKAIAVKEGVQRLSTRILTDPRFQDIHKKLLESIKSGSQKQQRGILVALGKILKNEDPELYEDFKSLTESTNKQS